MLALNSELNELLNELDLVNPNQMIENKNTKIIVGLSGGVDSSVSALILKAQGYDVAGVFMKNWEDGGENCTSEEDYKDVVKVCDHLEIPYYTLNFAKEYKENVFKDFLVQYQNGKTPNPDILCNSEIKFDVFFKNALQMGADLIATGHYCQIAQVNDQYYLKKGKDSNKDQSYFLHRIDSNVLSRTLFPIGSLDKKDVREIAKLAKIPTAQKKDSTGICFIGEKNFRSFLSRYIKSTKGKFIELDSMKEVGIHKGQCFYTIGQRKGLGLGGAGEAWFVANKDKDTNSVFVVRGEDHPALYSYTLKASDLHMLNSIENLPKVCKAKIRYRQLDQDCKVKLLRNGQLEVHFIKPQRAIAPGQSIVFYNGEHCLGGALIEKSGLSEYDKNKSINEERSI